MTDAVKIDLLSKFLSLKYLEFHEKRKEANVLVTKLESLTRDIDTDAQEIEKIIEALDDLYMRAGLVVMTVRHESSVDGREARFVLTFRKFNTNTNDFEEVLQEQIVSGVAPYGDFYRDPAAVCVKEEKFDADCFMSTLSYWFWERFKKGQTCPFEQFAFRGKIYQLANLGY